MGRVDLGFVGKRFTWSNGQEGLALIQQRLDRAIANHQWLELLPKAKVKNLTTESSNHCPSLLSLTEVIQKMHKRFHFFEAWASDQLGFQVVEAAWKDG